MAASLSSKRDNTTSALNMQSETNSGLVHTELLSGALVIGRDYTMAALKHCVPFCVPPNTLLSARACQNRFWVKTKPPDLAGHSG
jgi:hypothetical protein